MIIFNSSKRIILVGNGWGAISAFKSLNKLQNPISVITDDKVILSEKPSILQNLDGLKDEIIVFAGYKPIVPLEILNNNTCINIHYSLLPTYRGLHSTVWAILNDEPRLGLTVHEMDQYIDNGPIIYQYSIENDFVSTSKDYMVRFNQHIEENLHKIVLDYLNGIIKPKIQDKSLASWVGRRKEDDCQINFNKPLEYQKAFFRALVYPYPLPFFIFKGKKYIVLKTEFHKSNIITHNGRILNIDDEGLWIKVEKGYLIVKDIIDEDHKAVSPNMFKIGQFLNR